MGKGSGSRFFKQFSSDTAGYSKSRFELNVRKDASNKIIFQIFAFLINAAGLKYNVMLKDSDWLIRWVKTEAPPRGGGVFAPLIPENNALISPRSLKIIASAP